MVSGIAPELWGPYVWAAIHLTCLAAPADLAAGFHHWLTGLPSTLPCQKCRDHLAAHYREIPFEPVLKAGGEGALFDWSVALHNAVNRQLGKPEMSLEDARKLWTAIAFGKVVYMDAASLGKGGGAKNNGGAWAWPLVFLVLGTALGIAYSRFRTGGLRRR